MVEELRDLNDPTAAAKRIAKYTECFDILDKLGADNCVDPEDFDKEDLNDEMFKNLEISDIEEIFKEDDEQIPLIPGCEPQDFTDDNKEDLQEQDEEALSNADDYVEVTPVEMEMEDELLIEEPLPIEQKSDIQSDRG